MFFSLRMQNDIIRSLVLVRRVDDRLEGSGLERSAADEAAVDVELREQAGSVFSVHRAAVLDGDRAGSAGAEERTDGVADEGADFAGLFNGRGLAGADGPDGFVGDDDLADLVGLNVLERHLDLVLDAFGGDAGFAFGQRFADANDRAQTGIEGLQDLLVDGFVGFGEVLSAFAVADDDVLNAHFGEHFGRNFAGVGAGRFVVHVLGTDSDLGRAGRLQSGRQIDERNAENGGAPFGFGDHRTKFVDESTGFLRGFVHFPVARDDRFAVSSVHGDILLIDE